MSRTLARTAAVLLALTLVAAACSSDDTATDDTATDGTAGARARTSTTRPSGSGTTVPATRPASR